MVNETHTEKSAKNAFSKILYTRKSQSIWKDIWLLHCGSLSLYML